jgi:hypothetical protein
MIVVEDTEANEIHRFFVVDSSVRLGIVRAGTSIQTFDPNRAFTFYVMVENQLHDFAGQYPGAFRYLPRRAYGYLKKPELLGEFFSGVADASCSSWLADLLVTTPIIRLQKVQLPDAQMDANSQSIYRWSNVMPKSIRLYNLQDMRMGRRTPNGWGCLLGAEDLRKSLKGPNRNDLLTHIKMNRPVFVELGPPSDIEPLLEWLVLLKEAGLGIPNLVFDVEDHRSWSKETHRLLEIPGSRLLTSGATISSISSLVRHASQDEDCPWSSRFLFASSYPETQRGDSVSEVISYFLSRNLGAEPPEVQRVLGGNMLSLLPPRPPHLYYSESQHSVMAEESLGKSAMNELVRILQILRARRTLSPSSLDFMVEDDGGSVFLDGGILTVMDPATEKANSLSILLEKNGSVMISGWKKAFTESLVTRNALMLQTLTRANAKLDGPVFRSPAHLVRFDEEVMKCLQVSSPRDIMSALHFGVEIAKTDVGTFLMAPSDMETLELESGGLVLALDVRLGQWYPAVAKPHSRCREHTIVVSEEDASLFGFRESTVVNIAKFDGEVVDLSDLVLACDSSDLGTGQELYSYLHLHSDEILSLIDGKLVGIDSRFQAKPKRDRVYLTVADTSPRLEVGHVGRASASKTRLRPVQGFGDLDVVICISTGKDMLSRDIKLETPLAAKRALANLCSTVPELSPFLDALGRDASRTQIAALASLIALNLLVFNQSDGKLGLVTFGEHADKFSVQHGENVRNYVEFSKDIHSEEVVAALAYSILDTTRSADGRENTALAYRSVAEYLDDFGSDRPTLVLIFSNGVGQYDEEHLPFIRALTEKERYRIDLFVMGEETSGPAALRLLKGLNANIIETRRFSSQKFAGHVLDAMHSLLPSSTVRSEG